MTDLMVDKLVIGTAQMGMSYGISNRTGKINNEELDLILSFCHEKGIVEFDTAQAYGEAEDIMAEYQHPHKICTKAKFELSPSESNIDGKIKTVIEKSLAKFTIIDCFLLHSFDDYLYYPIIMSILKEYQSQGKIIKIGVSIYNVSEATILLEDNSINVIQLPFNYVDQQWVNPDFIRLLSTRPDIEICARSIFLQGLLLTSPKVPPKIKNSYEHLQFKIDELCKQLALTKLQLCLAYVCSVEWINKIIVGIDNHNQLKEIYNELNNTKKLSSENLALIRKEMTNVDPNLTNPSKWF